MDECADASQCPGQMCVNTVGSYRCVSCRAGYTLISRQCTGALMSKTNFDHIPVPRCTHTHIQPLVILSADMNECEAGDPCPGQQCVNTEGSYSCVSCQQGYHTVNGKCAGNVHMHGKHNSTQNIPFFSFIYLPFLYFTLCFMTLTGSIARQVRK